MAMLVYAQFVRCAAGGLPSVTHHYDTAMTESSESLDVLFGRAAARVLSASDPWAGIEYLAAREGQELPPRTPTSGEAAAATSDAAVQAVAAATAAAEAASLVSSNDTLEDLPTRSLRFVMLPFLAAAARVNWQGDLEGRLEALSDARRELMMFFHGVDALGLLSEHDRDRVLDNVPELLQTPTQRREALFARHKAEKASEQKLEKLLARYKDRSSSGAAGNGDGDDIDEEHERDALLTILQSAVRRGMDAVSSIDRELEVLRYAVDSQARGIDPAKKAAQERQNGPPPVIGGLPSTFRIVADKREELRNGVFRPDHSIPTLTVEEWGEIKAKETMAARQEMRQREELKARSAADEDSDGDVAADRETYEKRKWDLFTDDNKKGSGNSMR
jgi:immunoglobulin-binding protein 1